MLFYVFLNSKKSWSNLLIRLPIKVGAGAYIKGVNFVMNLFNKSSLIFYLEIHEIAYESLLPPVMTLCPGSAWKSSGPFFNEEHFNSSTYSEEEIFHPKTLNYLRNESLFILKQQYASYYGLCFVIQKLTPEKLSDYSFQIVVNKSIDYNYYLHEPLENEYLFMSIFPYEVVLKRIDARNNDHFGAADLIIHKEIVKKLPEKGGCQQIPLADYNHCWRKKIAESFANHPNLTCKVPAFRFTDFNTSHLKGL